MSETSETRHMPGPWTFEVPPPDAYTDPDLQLDEDVAYWIAETRVAGEVLGHVNKTARGQEEANARLFAAAPELLAALRALVDFHGQPARIGFTPGPAGEQDYSEAWTRYRAALAALANAEGR